MKFAEIALVKFPFSDLESSKKRPALVLSQTSLNESISLVTIAMITSRIDGVKLSGDCKIKNWENAGLLFPSLIRFSKIATVESGLIDKTLGTLSDTDLKSAKRQLQKVFKAWLQ